MKNIIIFIFMLVMLDYVFKDNNSVVTTVPSKDSYYEELRVKRMTKPLIVRTKYSSEVLASSN